MASASTSSGGYRRAMQSPITSHDSTIASSPDEAPAMAIVYGQRLNKSRVLSAVTADTEHHRFLVATLSLHSSSNNEVHLLEYSEDHDDDIYCHRVFSSSAHPNEIWNICCSPQRRDLFFTIYNEGTDGFHATLWKMPYDDLDIDDEASAGHSAAAGTAGELDALVTLPPLADDKQLHSILWQPTAAGASSAQAASGSGDRLFALYGMQVREYRLDASRSAATTGTSYALGRKIYCGKWDPVHADLVSVGATNKIVVLDTRLSPQKPPALTINDAHDQRVTDIDYNPYKPSVIASGGDDGFVKFWDLRSGSSQQQGPLRALGGHSHWITKVKYNPSHDELLLTSSTDKTMNLWRMYSLSSKAAVASATSSGQTKQTGASASAAATGTSPPPAGAPVAPADTLLRKLNQDNEESVYSIDWSRKNPWVFASVSYDGRFLIHQVPQHEQDRILGIDSLDDDEEHH